METSILGTTRAKILRTILSEPKTAGQIAKELHVQTSAARKHLDHLADLDLVVERFEKSGVGRPKKLYGLTENGKELFPRRYASALNQVLGKIAEKEGPDHAESLMKDLARDLARTLDGRRVQSPTHVRSVEEGVNQVGFEATFRKDDGSSTMISRNCPLWKASQEQREIVCRGFHAELLKRAFGAESVERQKWMVDGDNYCQHLIILS